MLLSATNENFRSEAVKRIWKISSQKHRQSFFINVGPSGEETSFLTTFFGLYFSHHYTLIGPVKDMCTIVLNLCMTIVVTMIPCGDMIPALLNLWHPADRTEVLPELSTHRSLQQEEPKFLTKPRSLKRKHIHITMTNILYDNPNPIH